MAAIVEETYAVQIARTDNPTTKVTTDMPGLTGSVPALRSAATMLAEEARRLVPGGDIEIRSTVYEGGYLKVYAHQGFIE